MKLSFIAMLLILPAIVFGQGNAKNIFYLMPASYTHEETIKDSKGVGFGYERFLGKNSRWSAELPVSIGLPGLYGNYNNDITLKILSSYSFAPEIKLYLSRKKSKIKYAIGASFFYDAGKEQTANYGFGFWEPPFLGYTNRNYQVFGYLFSNSLSFYPGKRLLFSINADAGWYAKQVVNGATVPNPQSDNSFLGPCGIYRFSLKVGYRF